jgi:hypothetical protein
METISLASDREPRAEFVAFLSDAITAVHPVIQTRIYRMAGIHRGQSRHHQLRLN